MTDEKAKKKLILLEQAKQKLDANQDDQALQLYLQACQNEPGDPIVWLEVAAIYLRKRQYPESLEAIAKVLKANTVQETRPHLIAAAALKGMGRHLDANRAVDAALAVTPDDAKALTSKAGILLALQTPAEVVCLTERVLEIDSNNLDARLYLGVALQTMRQPHKALAAFDQLLAIKPDHASALMNRSSVLITLDRPQDALLAADAALAIQPDAPIALLNKTAALLALKQPQKALATSEQLLKFNSRHIKGLINKIIALLALGNFSAALTTTLNALTFDSYNTDLWDLKVQALIGLKRFAEAQAECQKILSKYPDRITAHLNLAKSLIGLGSASEAAATIDTILAAIPNHPEAVSLKAEILVGHNAWESAATLIEKALAQHPDQAPLWIAKSVILLARKQYMEALVAIDQALALWPDHPQAAINKMAALNNLQRFADALATGQSLIASGVQDWQLYANLGGALSGLKQFPQARQAFATADALDHDAFQIFRWRHEVYGVAADSLVPPIDPYAEYLSFKITQLERCDWQDYSTIIEQAETLVRENLSQGQLTPLPPFKSLSLPFLPETVLAMARSQAAFLDSGMSAARERLALTYPALAMTDRLKIGYVSADFREHPTAHLMRGLFSQHDRKNFEIFVYALCKDDGSDYYQRIKADADQFVDLTELNNAQAAMRINNEGIHILVDLMGYTGYARTEIFALRPAPVQVSYLGYPGTLGAPFIPYILADDRVLPESVRPYFTEQPVYLPECYQINDDSQEIAATGIQRRDVGLPETAFVFCCFNKPAKIDPVIFTVWMKILAQVPNSVLWLLAADDAVTLHLRREAEAQGIVGERLLFAQRLPKAQHLERHRLADLFLDTRLYNAHTTASDALWAGLPVLTCRGNTFPSRVAASLLQAVGLPELITDSLEDYQAKAIHLATTPAELRSLRAKLAYNRTRAPLFDTPRFTRHLEEAYRLMWDRHVRGLSPAPLWVTPLPTDAWTNAGC